MDGLFRLGVASLLLMREVGEGDLVTKLASFGEAESRRSRAAAPGGAADHQGWGGEEPASAGAQAYQHVRQDHVLGRE